jgi:hypothetical protein
MLWIAWDTGASAPEPGLPFPLTRSRLNANANSVITAFATKAVISQMTCATKYAIIGRQPRGVDARHARREIAGKYWSS